METNAQKLKSFISNNNEREIVELLNSGMDPNLDGGWPVRLAARNGYYLIVKTLLQFGANPHLLSEAGASTLQLAIYSGQNWFGGRWNFLLSYCDSSQLADGAAVAIIFQNITALESIMSTGRCNTNIPTTLTGKTVEQLAKGYKLHNLLTNCNMNTQRNITPTNSPRTTMRHQAGISTFPSRPEPTRSHLSPSVARFFNQTASQTMLTSPSSSFLMSSPNNGRVLT